MSNAHYCGLVWGLDCSKSPGTPAAASPPSPPATKSPPPTRGPPRPRPSRMTNTRNAPGPPANQASGQVASMAARQNYTKNFIFCKLLLIFAGKRGAAEPMVTQDGGNRFPCVFRIMRYAVPSPTANSTMAKTRRVALIIDWRGGPKAPGPGAVDRGEIRLREVRCLGLQRRWQGQQQCQ